MKQGRHHRTPFNPLLLAVLCAAALLCGGCAGHRAPDSLDLVGGYTYVTPPSDTAELKGLTLLAMNDALASDFAPLQLAQVSDRNFAAQYGDDELGDYAGNASDDEFGDYTPDDEAASRTAPHKALVPDPFEDFNRAMFQFNDFLYFYLLKPAGIGYKALVPQPMRIGLRNAFYNIRFPVRFVNDVLQGKIANAGREILRFLVDTIFGFGGLVRCSRDHELLNPAPQDLGRTFATWGIGPGPYFVWPFFGPKTLRETVGDIGDTFADPIFWTTPPWYTPYLIRAGETINTVSLQIGEYEALKEAAIDPYTAMKDIYMQFRTRSYDKEDKPVTIPSGTDGQ